MTHFLESHISVTISYHKQTHTVSHSLRTRTPVRREATPRYVLQLEHVTKLLRSANTTRTRSYDKQTSGHNTDKYLQILTQQLLGR